MSISSNLDALVDAVAAAINARNAPAGASAYDIAVINGFVGTQAQWLTSLQGVTPGDVKIVATAAAPAGWLLCDGSAVSRATYSALYTAIGTTYGAGDGSTTFNLPDARGKVIAGVLAGDASFGTLGQTGGEKAHTLSVAEMPSHSHAVTDNGHSHSSAAHSHGVTDNGHSHNANHGHSTTDNGHAHTASHGHSLWDNGHGHVGATVNGTRIYWQSGVRANGTGSTFAGSGVGTSPSDPQTLAANANVGVNDANYWTSTNGTGLGVNANNFNTGSSGAGITINSTTPGNTGSSGTGISVGSAGSGAAHNVLQPFLTLNYAIKI